uniref:Single domain-containing protein n=1 Tax=Anopheles farauti TaxID=69004 RepID=A0A182QBK8_9DIPT
MQTVVWKVLLLTLLVTCCVVRAEGDIPQVDQKPALIPKTEKEQIKFKKTDEYEPGSACELDGFVGVCVTMDECEVVGPKSKNDGCLSNTKDHFVCCPTDKLRVDSTTAAIEN